MVDYEKYRAWLNEASVPSLVQRYKIPQELAQYVNDNYKQNADILLGIFVNRYSSFGDLEGESDKIIENFERFMNFKGNAVDGLLKRFPKKKQELLTLAKDNWKEFILYMKKIQDEQETKENAVINFPDGFYWLNLKVSSCSKEAGAMQHCGFDPNGILYSLRDSANNPHVTISKDDNNIVFQIKGKQNEFPKEKYWNYIFKFLKHFNVEKIIEPILDPDFEVKFYEMMDTNMTSEQLVINFRNFLQEAKVNIVKELDQTLEQYKDFYWVFFDTETTGLSKEIEQITEIAAWVVDFEFLTSETRALDVFHSKVKLGNRVKTRLKYPLSGPLAPGQLSTTDVLKLTKYGMPSKRKGADPTAAVYGSIPMEDSKIVLEKFINFLEKYNSKKPVLLVAHNAKFDVSMVNQKLQDAGMDQLTYPSLDTLDVVKGFFEPLLKASDTLEEYDEVKKNELNRIYKALNAKAFIKAQQRGDISKRLGHIAEVLSITTDNWHSAIADVEMLMKVTREVVRIIKDNPDIEKEVPDKKVKSSDTKPESLQEARLSRVWRKRAVARAKRNEREYPNKIDKKWALKQQEKWNKNHPELEEEYLREIEYSQNLTKTTKEYLNKIKDIRKQKLEVKKSKDGTVPFGPGTPQKLPKGKNLPDKTVQNKQGVLSKIERERKKARGPTVSGSGTFGGIALEESEENYLQEIEIIPMEEKGDGESNN